MQSKVVTTITLEQIHRDILISIMLSLNLKDLHSLSLVSKFWNALFNHLLTNFDSQLAFEWIKKIKADITNEPPQYTSNKVLQYKNFYKENMVERPRSNGWIAVKTREIGAFFYSIHGTTSFQDKVDFYSTRGFDILLSQLLKNNPKLTKLTYDPGYCGMGGKLLKDAIASGFNKLFDLHFTTLKSFIPSSSTNASFITIPFVINYVDNATERRSLSLLHFAVQKANIYCLEKLLNDGGNPLKMDYSNQSTCYTFALKLDSKHRNTIFNSLLKYSDKDKLKDDLSNLNSDEFQRQYRVSKSSMSLMLVQTQNDLLLTSTDKNKVKVDLNDLTPDAFEKEYGISKSSLSIDDAREETEPSNLSLKK